MLCGGDITKRNYILENVTLDEIPKFVEYRTREYLAREVILNFAGVKNETLEKKVKKFQFCSACRKIKKDINCRVCKNG